MESYEREINAIRFISSKISGACGITKFLGGGTANFENLCLPWPLPEKDAPVRYQDFAIVSMDQCSDEHTHDFFYYLMAAADNLAAPPRYQPATLENVIKDRHSGNKSEEWQSGIIAELIDTLLFLYEGIPAEIRNDEKTARFHGNNIPVVHGDISPKNIFFVNGHALLGDFGCTLGIDPEKIAHYESPGFAPASAERARLSERCGGNALAFGILLDLYALGKTVRFMVGRGDPESAEESDTPVKRLSDELISFQYRIRGSISTEKILASLHELRILMPNANHFFSQSIYSAKTPVLEVGMAEFSRLWTTVRTNGDGSFVVRNSPTVWNGASHDLSARRCPKSQLDSLAQGNDSKTLMIYSISDSDEIIVLSNPLKRTAFGQAMIDSLERGTPQTFELTFDGHRMTAPCSDFIETTAAEQKILGELELCRQAAVLDWGCGVGRHLSFLRGRRRDIVCFGVDIDEQMLDCCRRRIGKPCMFCTPSDFPSDARFDLILLMGNGLGIFGTEENTLEQLKKFRDILNPGGQLLLESGNPMGSGFSTVSMTNSYHGLTDGPFLWGAADRQWVEHTLRNLNFTYNIIPDDIHRGFFFALAKLNGRT